MSKQPKHVAIIMDGNGRWAKQRHLPRVAGHREGAKAVRRAVEYASQHDVDVLTLFALSVENYHHRPKSEVKLLLSLLRESLQENTESLHEHGIRIRVIGDRSVFEPSLLTQIEASEALTVENTGMTLVIALNYSGRWDITQAAQKLLNNNTAVTESALQENLCLADLSEPDLLIRTSGEERISNFLLWQLAYSELFFTEQYWPDFDDTLFAQALESYAKRQRRFGLTEDQLGARCA